MATTMGEQSGGAPAEQTPPALGAKPRRRRQLGWVIPLVVVALAFVVYSVPPYLTFDPAQSRLPLPEGYPFFYPLLVAHIIFGTVALLAGCFQVWPWFRGKYPHVHRWMGRAYFFAGVFPGGIAILGVTPFTSTGLVGHVGNSMLALLWLATGIAGWRAARQRRFPDHRRWMLRSFALTTSIVMNRLWIILLIIAQTPQVDTVYGGDEDAMILAVSATAIWLSWVVNLVVVEWWLGITGPSGKRKTRRPPRERTAAAPER